MKTLKSVIFGLFYVTGRISHYVYPEVLSKLFNAIVDRIYTGYISNRFVHLGQSIFQWHAHTLCGCEYISIGNGNTFEKGIQLSARKTGTNVPQITIGNGCLIRSGAHITAVNSITIGDGLLTGNNVLISDNTHGDINKDNIILPPRKRLVTTKGAVTIGNNVWLGNNVCVLSGVTLGDGVIVGANSVVTHNMPPYTVVAGIPAKIIKAIKLN